MSVKWQGKTSLLFGFETPRPYICCLIPEKIYCPEWNIAIKQHHIVCLGSYLLEQARYTPEQQHEFRKYKVYT